MIEDAYYGAQIIVRNLDAVEEPLKAPARTNESSLEAKVRQIREQSARVDMAQARHIVMERRKKLHGREFVDSIELIHEGKG